MKFLSCFTKSRSILVFFTLLFAVCNFTVIRPIIPLQTNAETIKTLEIEPRTGIVVGSGNASFYYSGSIPITVSSSKTARTLKVIGARDGVTNTGATARITASNGGQSFTFPLNGNYHTFNIIDFSGKTVTYNIEIISGDVTQKYNVAILLLD